MDPQYLRLERVLRAYKDRGLLAFEALQRDDWESFEQKMRWRRAAFLHFRAIDHLLQIEGARYSEDPFWQAIWSEIEVIDQKLENEMEEQKGRLAEQLTKVRQHRSALGKYQSGGKQQIGFLDTI